jgi:hypothetical protein
MLVDQTTKNQGSKAQKNYSGNIQEMWHLLL